MHPLSWKVMTWSLGLFCAVSFVLCVLYGFVVPKTLHMVQFLEITLPGFRWLSPGSTSRSRAMSPLSGISPRFPACSWRAFRSKS